MPIMVSTVFAKSAVLPTLSAERAVKSIEEEIGHRRFREFQPIILDETNELQFETSLTSALLQAYSYIYEKHCKQEKFLKSSPGNNKKITPSYDLDMASMDEKEQPYVVIYKKETENTFQLLDAIGCGSHGRSFDPNKGNKHTRLIIKDPSHPLLSPQRMGSMMAKIFPELYCEDEHGVENSRYKRFLEYEVPFDLYNPAKQQYQMAVGEYQGYGSGYLIKMVSQNNSLDIQEHDIFDPYHSLDEIEETDFDWETEKEIEVPQAAPPSLKTPPLLKDLFPQEKKDIDVANLPQKFICQLTQKPMTDPVFVNGPLRSEYPLAYERSALEEAFDEQGFDKSDIIEDRARKREIDDYQEHYHKEAPAKKR